MTAACMILLALAFSLFVMVVCPVLLLFLCAAVQGRLSGRHLPYPLILPALTGMASLLCGCYVRQGSPLWLAPLLCARMSFAGSMAGWVVSRNFKLPQRTKQG